MIPDPHVDPESFLESFRAGSETIGFDPPTSEVELHLADAIAWANELMAVPHRVLPPVQGAVVAALRGVVAALNEDGLDDLYRYNRRHEEKWWTRAYETTHTLTRHRFDIYSCTGCGERVHGAYTGEHASDCRVHACRESELWDPACPSCGLDRYDHCTECRGCLDVQTPDGLVCERGCEGDD